MSRPVAVLKFGGSVLADESACRVAVHEIYRVFRQGYSVLAVCSAFRGETDRLVASAHALSAAPLAEAYSALLRTGELRSSACLALACDGAGLPTTILDTDQISLRTTGPLHDASPISVDTAAIRHALDESGVVVVPGFCGRDEHGNVSLLGRGGSDLTAIFLANALEAASCRLIKDVHGWFSTESDARCCLETGTIGKRYRTLSLSDASRRDESIVQAKAVLLAATTNTTFCLGRAGLEDDTSVSNDHATALDLVDAPRRLRVGLLGVGTVGAGVWRHLAAATDLFDLVGGVVQNVDAVRPTWIDRAMLHTSIDSLPYCDILIEALPDAAAAYPAVKAALGNGVSVVSANKALIARHGEELGVIASLSGATLRYAAAAGGACPVLELANRLAESDEVVSVRAVLNATTNVVLDGIRGGLTLTESVDDATRRGFAEADPSTDLSGRDAANKLALIYHRLTGDWMDPDAIETEDARELPLSPDRVVRQVAELRLGATPTASVRIVETDDEDLLTSVTGDWNAAVFETRSGRIYAARGRGAGRWPTAESVVADVFDTHRYITRDMTRNMTLCKRQYEVS